MRRRREIKCGCGKWTGPEGWMLSRCRFCVECNAEMHTQNSIIRHYGHYQNDLELSKLDGRKPKDNNQLEGM